MSAPRAACPVCERSTVLRKDGTVREHHRLNTGAPCPGVGQRPLRPGAAVAMCAWCFWIHCDPVPARCRQCDAPLEEVRP